VCYHGKDWFGDGLSWQWSYYAALMSSATRLATPLGGTKDFGGYVVPLSSGGRVDGGLLRRVVSLVGGGAKGMSWFIFGPGQNSVVHVLEYHFLTMNGIFDLYIHISIRVQFPRQLLQ
jgi:hypothetical protein